MSHPDQTATEPRRPVRILHADDDPIVARGVDLLLKGKGYQTEWVNNGTDALARIRSRPEDYALLITDQNMPGLTGVQLVRCLGEADFRGEVIVFSSDVSRDVGEQFASLRVKHQLSKSARLPALLAMVQEILSEPQTPQP